MTKRANAAASDLPVAVDDLVVEYLRRETDPETAGREAAFEVFEGLGASFTAFVAQRMGNHAHAD